MLKSSISRLHHVRCVHSTTCDVYTTNQNMFRFGRTGSAFLGSQDALSFYQFRISYMNNMESSKYHVVGFTCSKFMQNFTSFSSFAGLTRESETASSHFPRSSIELKHGHFCLFFAPPLHPSPSSSLFSQDIRSPSGASIDSFAHVCDILVQASTGAFL